MLSHNSLTETTLDKEKKVLEYLCDCRKSGILLASGKLEPGISVPPRFSFCFAYLLWVNSVISDQCPLFVNLESWLIQP